MKVYEILHIKTFRLKPLLSFTASKSHQLHLSKYKILEEYCGIVKYILFVSREIWPPFNSLYAYIKIKKEFPREVVLLYTDENIVQKIERKIKKLYQIHEKDIILRKRKINQEISFIRKILLDILEDGDIIDITGARKAMILALVGVENIRIVYLHLYDMRFSEYPFMMRPLSLQKLMEVSQ